MVSRGKYKHLRDLYSSFRFFRVTKANRENWEQLMDTPLEVGERLVMRPMPMTPELLKALG